MKARLKELIENLKQEKVVKRIYDAADHWKCFVSIQSDFQAELKEFKELLQRTGPIDYGEISHEEAIEIFMICFMGDIDDKDLLEDRIALYDSLRSINCGGWRESIACSMSEFLFCDSICGTSESKKFLVNEFFWSM